jgi:hypothetical protein
MEFNVGFFASVSAKLPPYDREVLLLWQNANPYPRKRWISIGQRTHTDKNGHHYSDAPEAANGFRPVVIGWMELPDTVTMEEAEQNRTGDFDE